MTRMRSAAAAVLAACLMILSGCMPANEAEAPLIDIECTPTPVPTPRLTPEPTPEPSPTPDAASPGVLGETALLPPDLDPAKPMVALTYDDGPSRKTERILDCLEANGARATFFVVGTQLERFPEITKRASDLGCEIGNHTYDHANLTKISGDEIKQQLGSVNELVLNATGKKVTLVRNPYGAGIKDEHVKKYMEYPMIMWSIDTLDWSTRDTDETLKAIRKDVQDGSIILMHDLYDATAAATEIIVPELIAEGYQLVTVTELFAAKGIPLEAAHYYRNAHPKD
ncbi:MAG: hypothetical protein E7330_08930 [Clostridiales bacterium]|nr:hypothetical protein [Clostridiales bacterium]